MIEVAVRITACPFVVQAVDASLARAFRELRNAEVAGDPAAVDAARTISGAPDAVARAALARDAIARRSAATTAAELVSVEDRLETERAELAARVGARDAECAAELLLECAEDLLLRRIVADGSDAMIAIGLATETERNTARERAARARMHLDSPLLAPSHAEGVSLATDAKAFRWHLLAGVAALMTDDRAAAAPLLARAAQSELPLPAEIAAVLALAEVEASAGSMQDDARARLLAIAARTADPTRAFVARVEAWRASDGRAPFPTGVAGVSPQLALTAEIRARLEAKNEQTDAHDAMLAAVRRALGDSGDPRLMIATLTPRLDRTAREAFAADDGADALLRAIAAAHPSARDTLAAAAERMTKALGDPLIAPWLAIPLATELQKAGRARDAAAILIDFVDLLPNDPAARDSIDIACAIARTEAARDRAGEALLDRALAVACTRFASDPAHDAWAFSRVDLALWPQWGAPDAERAEQRLSAVSADPARRTARDLRTAEIAGLRVGGDSTAALAVARSAEGITGALGPNERPLAARAEALRAEMLLVAQRPAEALACARIVLAEPQAEPMACVRAARVWFGASALRDGDDAAPEALAVLAAREPTVRAMVEAAVASASARVEDLLIEGDIGAARTAARGRLAIALAALPPGMALGARADALVALANGDAIRAAESADRASKRWPSDRTLQWIHAEALRVQAGTDPAMRERAFAMFRELSPLATKDRDPVWWRAQLAQLELIAADPARAREALARANRLAALDPSLGGASTAKRFNMLREQLAKPSGGTP